MNRVAPILAVGALGLLVAVLIAQLMGPAGGPEGELIGRLKHLERDGVEWKTAEGTLFGTSLQYQRLSVTLDAAGTRAVVTSTLDFTGNFQRADGSRTQVSSLGLERAGYVLRDEGWQPETTDGPRLGAIIDTLEGRRRKLEAGAALPDGGLAWADVQRRALTSEAWFIRSERGEILASEDFRLTGTSPDRPVDVKGTTRLSLQEDADGGFTFPDGVL